MVECLRNTDIKVKIPLKCNSFQGSLKKNTLCRYTQDRSKYNFEAKLELMSQSPMISKSTVLEISSLILEK